MTRKEAQPRLLLLIIPAAIFATIPNSSFLRTSSFFQFEEEKNIRTFKKISAARFGARPGRAGSRGSSLYINSKDKWEGGKGATGQEQVYR